MSDLPSTGKPHAAWPNMAQGSSEIARMRKLLDAAQEVFLSLGFHRATMDDVAKAAGMSKKTVYALAGSKAGLFEALLAYHQSLLTFPEPAPDAPPETLLEEYLLTLARFLLAPGQIAILRLIMTEYVHGADLCEAFFRGHVSKVKQKLEDSLARIAREHQGCSQNTRELSAMLFGMALGEFHLSTLIGFRMAPGRAELEKRVHEAVRLFMKGWLG